MAPRAAAITAERLLACTVARETWVAAPVALDIFALAFGILAEFGGLPLSLELNLCSFPICESFLRTLSHWFPGTPPVTESCRLRDLGVLVCFLDHQCDLLGLFQGQLLLTDLEEPPLRFYRRHSFRRLFSFRKVNSNSFYFFAAKKFA